jgi:hypothetical protein
MSCLITEMQMNWFVTIDVLGGATGTRPVIGQGHPMKGTSSDFHPPSSVTLASEVNLLQRIYCCATWNAKLSWMVVWVLRRIYYYIILNVNCHEWLYEYYEGSTVALYWMLIVTNGCMSITKDLSLYYVEGYLSRMFIWVLRRIYYCAYIVLNCYKILYEYYKGSIIELYWTLIVVGWVIQRVYCYAITNAKLLRNVCSSITKDLLLCILNIKLLRNICTSFTKCLLLCYNEC